MNFKRHKQYRLPYFNYSSSAYYFVTICSNNRKEIFGEVDNGEVTLSSIGAVVHERWINIPIVAPYVELDIFQVMPNHFHGILFLNNPDEPADIEEKKFQPQRNSLSIVVRNFKAAATARARQLYPKITIWQSRFFDRIIREEKELQRIRKYILDNPLQWEIVRNNTENLLM